LLHTYHVSTGFTNIMPLHLHKHHASTWLPLLVCEQGPRATTERGN